MTLAKYGLGVLVMATLQSSGSGIPFGVFSKLKECKSPDKNRKNSIFARFFPRHSRFPIPNITRARCGLNSKMPVFSSVSKNLSGLNSKGSGKYFGSYKTSVKAKPMIVYCGILERNASV